MRTIRRYIGKEVLFATLLIFAALLMLFAFFDLIHELGDVGRGDYTIGAALLFVALHIPSRLYELFPVAALIGTLFAVAQLVANSEYTVMRASGMSLLQLGWSVLRSSGRRAHPPRRAQPREGVVPQEKATARAQPGSSGTGACAWESPARRPGWWK